MENTKKEDVVKVKNDLGDKIWAEIKDVKLSLYGLPNQNVFQHVSRLEVPMPGCLIKLKSSAVLPALEEALGSKFSFESGEGYVVVSRRVDTADMVKEALKKV